jgi:hypothetical protein
MATIDLDNIQFYAPPIRRPQGPVVPSNARFPQACLRVTGQFSPHHPPSQLFQKPPRRHSLSGALNAHSHPLGGLHSLILRLDNDQSHSMPPKPISIGRWRTWDSLRLRLSI